jgi:hypothetical protein
MNPSEILNWLSSLPTAVKIIGGIIIFMLIFGQKILWDYEVKFPFKTGIGRGEIEFECGKKSGPEIECEFELDDTYKNMPIEIYLKDKKAYTITADRNRQTFIRIKEKTPLDKPEEGDEVTVKANGEPIFSGKLVLD